MTAGADLEEPPAGILEGDEDARYVGDDAWVIGRISGPRFEGELPIWLHQGAPGRVYATCQSPLPLHPMNIASQNLPVTENVVEELLADLRAVLPEHDIRSRINPNDPDQTCALPDGVGKYGAFLGDDALERMPVRFREYVQGMTWPARHTLRMYQRFMAKEIADGAEDWRITMRRIRIALDKATYREQLTELIGHIDFLQAFVEAELAAVEGESSAGIDS